MQAGKEREREREREREGVIQNTAHDCPTLPPQAPLLPTRLSSLSLSACISPRPASSHLHARLVHSPLHVALKVAVEPLLELLGVPFRVAAQPVDDEPDVQGEQGIGRVEGGVQVEGCVGKERRGRRGEERRQREEGKEREKVSGVRGGSGEVSGGWSEKRLFRSLTLLHCPAIALLLDGLVEGLSPMQHLALVAVEAEHVQQEVAHFIVKCGRQHDWPSLEGKALGRNGERVGELHGLCLSAWEGGGGREGMGGW